MNLVGVTAGCAMMTGLAAGQGPIGLGDFSGSEQVITFDPGFGSQCAPYEYEGVVFSETGGGTGGPCFRANGDWGVYFDNIPGSSQGIGFNDQWGDSRIIMEFPAGIRRVGCLLSTGPATAFTMDLFDSGGNLIGSDTQSMPASGEAVFIGYETVADIAWVEIWEPNGENGNISLMDDVRFEGVEGGFQLTITGDCPGTLDLCVSGATPNGRVGFGYGFSSGATAVPGCPGLNVDIANAQLAGLAVADGSGNACMSGRAPAAACGRVIVQAVDLSACVTSNVVGI